MRALAAVPEDLSSAEMNCPGGEEPLLENPSSHVQGGLLYLD
jgi:hypothetical protein